MLWTTAGEVLSFPTASEISSYDGDLSLPLGLALGSPIFPSGCEGKLGVAGKGLILPSGGNHVVFLELRRHSRAMSHQEPGT